MKTKTGFLLISSLVLCNLTACSYIKSLFPDKEKDYQYTTEIAPLILPDDLKKNATPQLPTVEASPVLPSVVDTQPAEQTASASANTSNTGTPDVAAINTTAIKVEHIKFTDGENRLRISTPLTNAWRIVGKALTRQSIEITERNQEAHVFTVHYDPDERTVADESYLDELMFAIKGLQGNDKTYLLKLEEQHEQTDVVVLDEDQKPLSDEASVKLLNVLENSMTADLVGK